MATIIRIDNADFDVGQELSALYARSDGQVGAVASFVGLVRDRAAASGVASLTLEHYPGMTEKSVAAITEQAAERWPLLDILVIHRVGTLLPREQIVYVQVASAHRDAAFAAATFIMDYLKTDAVLWKREAGDGGDRWIEASGTDRQRRASWETGSEAAPKKES